MVLIPSKLRDKYPPVRSNKMQKNLIVRAVTGLSAALLSGLASAATTDYTGIVTGTTAEFNGAVTAALPLAGLIIGVMVGFKAFKHFVK
jgi:phosphoribosylaminoimidazole (AIR) synthetase